MNAKTIAATLVTVASVTAGGAVGASATNDTAVCHREGNGSSHTIQVNNNSVLQAHLRHGDTLGPCPVITPTSTATVTATPSATPTPLPTITPTVTPVVPVAEGGDEDVCAPFAGKQMVRPANWFELPITLRDPDCGQFVTITVAVPPAEAVVLVPPVVTVTPAAGAPVPVAVPDFETGIGGFDISTITALPKAGDGSLG